MEAYSEIHKRHQGKSSDKWESYLRVYDRFFAPFRHEPVRIVEVGVQNGGSLEVLAKYFENAARIIGCDNNPLCGNLLYDDPRISVIVGDVNSRESFALVAQTAGSIDLFIDDGSHVSRDILTTFAAYFSLLAPGGIYIIEDTHCLYREAWSGGILRATTALQFFKLLTDVLNYEHWRNEINLATLLSSFFQRDAIPSFLEEGWIESIEFRNSMVVIRKAMDASQARLGSRIVVGRQFEVDRETQQFLKRA
jgi:SAM-dependent methyltransferase